MGDLLDRRFVVVMGKGGVGRTTVAAALGLIAARRGRRAILCEVSGQARLGELGTGFATISIEPESAKLEWLERQLRSRRLARLLGRSRVFELLTAAAPGLAELVTIGKVWDLAQLDRRPSPTSQDLVILDAPATGQGLALLEAPGTYVKVARVGPVHSQARRIAEFLRDPASTAVLGVALPEEMPVNETLELDSRLREDGVRLEAVIVNGLYPTRFTGDEAKRMAALDRRLPQGARAALRTALSEHVRARAQRSHLRRLRRSLAAPVARCCFCSSRSSACRRWSFCRALSRPRCDRAAARAQGGLYLRRFRGSREDDHRGCDRARHGRARTQGRRGDHRPGQAARELVGAPGARQRGAPDRHWCRRRAVGADARRQADVRRADRGARCGRAHPRHRAGQPDLPGALDRCGEVARVHGDGEAL